MALDEQTMVHAEVGGAFEPSSTPRIMLAARCQPIGEPIIRAA
jgi:hypothetical protein